MSVEGNDKKPPLLDELRGTSPRKLISGVENVESLSPEEEEGLERGGNQALRATKRKIKRWTWYAGFVIVVVLALGVLVGILVLGGNYVKYVIDNNHVASIMTDALGFLFGVTATLAVEFLWRIGARKAGD